MNYEEKYNQTIEAINRIYEQADSYGKELMEKEFPELCESEDERIRKCLIAIITDFKSLYLQENYSLSREEALDWLEKQGKQKPIDYNEELKKCRENPLYFFDKYCKIKIKKQNLSWGEEDDYILSLVSKFVSKGYKSHPKIPSLEFIQDWLKSIKERVQPLPKQEWSEEDELMLNSFLHKLEVCDLVSNKEITWIKNKLKSIKHWKPSEEQMKELEYVTKGNSYPQLTSLYQDLKNFES